VVKCCIVVVAVYSIHNIQHENVKQTHYRRGVAQKVPGN